MKKTNLKEKPFTEKPETQEEARIKLDEIYDTAIDIAKARINRTTFTCIALLAAEFGFVAITKLLDIDNATVDNIVNTAALANTLIIPINVNKIATNLKVKKKSLEEKLKIQNDEIDDYLSSVEYFYERAEERSHKK